MSHKWITTAFFTAMLSISFKAEAQWQKTRTYVVETQEYRESTRFTLTEWLRIKERMKMMDVWLAMFSDPKEDRRFRPELNLNYGVHRGKFNVTGDREQKGSLNGRYFKGQLWLTNIITGTIGIRMLNIDIGGEGYLRLTNNAYDIATGATTPDLTTAVNQDISARHYSVNMRIFGKSIQDSSIILKYGNFNATNTLYLSETPTHFPPEHEGRFMGGEMQFYLTKALGFEGNYHEYQKTTHQESGDTLAGTYYDYGVFLEVSLIRLMLGKYKESWTAQDTAGSYNITGDGYTFGLKLQF